MGENNSTINQPVILFDGVCNLCNASVQFIIVRDHKSYFKFCSLQSENGIALLKKFRLQTDKLHSIILIENDRVWDRSTAALRIAKKLKSPWPILYFFIIVPPFLRNLIYDWIARNRYQWFGRRNECMIPSPDLRARFL